jgi:catechol 2,3-dioxygenase-like lactoylglutathione lyase family enzyme
MGHLHFFTKNLDAHRKLWAGVFQGTPVKVGPIEAYRFPDLIVLFREEAPSGGTDGSAIGHVALKVRDLKGTLDKCRAAGVKIVNENPAARQAFLEVAEAVRVELIEDATMKVPVANHHLHFYTVSVPETQAWYVKVFGAKPAKRGQFEAADLPGVNLSFSAAKEPTAPTKGRALDHIGFEVRNLEVFCNKLEAAGVKLDTPYTQRPDLGIALAFVTDPWGVRIELTEGLNKL